MFIGVDDVQRFVSVMYSDGRNASLCVRDFIADVRKHDYICDNFVIRDRKIYGKDHRLNVTRVLTRREMMEKYWGYWIAAYPFFYSSDIWYNDCGVVCKVMTDEEYDIFREKCYADGTEKDYYFFYTDPNRFFPLFR